MATINLTSTSESGFLEDDFDQIKSLVDGIDDGAIVANTAKVTNATHTGEVTGATALTIADNVIDEANMKISNAPTDDYVLTADSAATGGWKWAEASGGGTPGGSDTEIQYNNSGAFDGITNVTTDGTDLFINGKQINIQTTAPTSPATGDIWIDIS